MGNINNSVCDGLFGKTRQSVLALLYGRADTSFYTKQILDTVKIGRGAVQRELQNLTDSGILTREVQGRQVYYHANTRCPIFNDLKSIVRKTFGAADIIRESLSHISSHISIAFIFGSLARSTDDRRSDIDVMIIGEVSFQSLAFTLHPDNETIEKFNRFRRKRNTSDYERVGMVSEKEVSEMLELARSLRTVLKAWLREEHADLAGK